MKKEIKNREAIFPMPVLMIATYNEDNSIDVMNAAWGTMVDRDIVALNLTETHKTVENIRKRLGFTVSLADAEHYKQADFFGVVSGHRDPHKFIKSGLSASKALTVDAPLIEEFPISFECEFIEFQDEKYGLGVIAKVTRVVADEKLFVNDKLDMSKVEAIAFDPYTHGYYKVTERVGEAFSDGLKLK